MSTTCKHKAWEWPKYRRLPEKTRKWMETSGFQPCYAEVTAPYHLVVFVMRDIRPSDTELFKDTFEFSRDSVQSATNATGRILGVMDVADFGLILTELDQSAQYIVPHQLCVPVGSIYRHKNGKVGGFEYNPTYSSAAQSIRFRSRSAPYQIPYGVVTRDPCDIDILLIEAHMGFIDQPSIFHGAGRPARRSGLILMGEALIDITVPVNSLNRLSYLDKGKAVTQSCMQVFPSVQASANEGDVVLCKDDFFGDWEHLAVYSGSCGGEPSGRHECSGEVWNYVKKVELADIDDDFCAKWGFRDATEAEVELCSVRTERTTSPPTDVTEVVAPYNWLWADATFCPMTMGGRGKTHPCFWEDTQSSLRVIQNELASQVSDLVGRSRDDYDDDDDYDGDDDDDYDSDGDYGSDDDHPVTLSAYVLEVTRNEHD